LAYRMSHVNFSGSYICLRNESDRICLSSFDFSAICVMSCERHIHLSSFLRNKIIHAVTPH
jgi:hypothetical protein